LVKYNTREFESEFNASMIGSFINSQYSRDRETMQFNGSYFFSNTWYFNGIISYQRNIELGIARRFQELAGIGNKFLIRNHLKAYMQTGLSFNEEKSTEDQTTGVLLEIPLTFKLDFFKYKKPNIQFSTTQSIYYSLSQANRYRYDGSINVNWEIIGDFYLNTNLYNNYDSKSPIDGTAKSDYGIVFGLTYKF